MSDFDSNPFADPEAGNPFGVSGTGRSQDHQILSL